MPLANARLHAGFDAARLHLPRPRSAKHPRLGHHDRATSAALLDDISKHLNEHDITPSLRHNRVGQPLIRFSPHFYNTEAELDRVAEVVSDVI